MATWGKEKDSYITLVTDGSGGDFVKCIFTVLTSLEKEVPGLLGDEVTVTGICLGLSEDYVIIEAAFSEDIPTYGQEIEFNPY